ncbi:MAG: hypothetical protein P4K93_08410 [Terracidiphilus sp.]|nr:hypothetical protein [Terracidiphilus sp.]MDR3798159.1 hypothetical protein [Terracidiphilus sp.]
MRISRPLCLLRIVFVLGIGLGSTRASYPATPSFTITATSVSLPGQGTGSSQITLTSVNGFAGTVGVSCYEPVVTNATEPVLPSCAEPVKNLVVPANGSVSGAILFYPPWETSHETASLFTRTKPHYSEPLLGGVFIGCGLLGWRLRKTLNRCGALVAAAVFCLSLAGLVGCMGHGGLAMTPGTYAYTISGASTGMTQTTTASVTVQCNSCP